MMWDNYIICCLEFEMSKMIICFMKNQISIPTTVLFILILNVQWSFDEL